MRSPRFLAAAALAALAPVSAAQDSVAKTNCSGGDSTSPYDLAEQCNDFVVDLNPFTTCWGTEFGIAPLLKGSKVAPGFNTTLISAQAISQNQVAVSGDATDYAAWTGPGIGVNNDSNVHDAPATVDAPCDMRQFGVAFAEFDQSYNGVIGATVKYQPSNPGRLYVNRRVAAINGCEAGANLMQFGMGSVNGAGDVFIRGDGFGVGGGCFLLPYNGDNIFSVSLSLRDCDTLNVVTNDAVSAFRDDPANRQYVVDSTTTHLTPSTVGTAASPTYFGLNFSSQAVYGTPGATFASGAYLGTGTSGSRGSAAYNPQNYAPLNSVNGLGACLATTPPNNDANALNVWGLGANGAPTGARAVVLPPSITDNYDGFVTTNLGSPGTLEFDHYGSQVAFRGGNGQVATRVLDNGDLLIAGTCDIPADGGDNFPINGIAVCKIDAVTGTETWTLAAYNDGIAGKELLDGPNGDRKGSLVPLGLVTGGAPQGPSMTSPMFDSKGNIYFLSSLFTDDDSDFATGLVRAVFDPASFSYQLDLVLKTGDTFTGENSTKDYLITFLGIADGNSISSGTAWSNNMSAEAHGGLDPATFDNADPRANGGIVLSAAIVYDANDDGDFTDCGDGGVDEDYNVLLYIGHCGWENLGFGKPRSNGVTPKMSIKGNQTGGSLVTLSLRDMEPGQSFFLVNSAFPLFAPFKGGILVPNPDFIFPAFPTGTGSIDLPFAWPVGLDAFSCIPLYYQTWITGPGMPGPFSATNAITSELP